MVEKKEEKTPRCASTAGDSPSHPRSIKKKIEDNPLPSEISNLAAKYQIGDTGTKHCHLCRQPFKQDHEFVQCTIAKGKAQTRCNNRFHARFEGDCFSKHVQSSPVVRSRAPASQLDDHVSEPDYIYRCAKCLGNCKCCVCKPRPKAPREEAEEPASPPKKKLKVSAGSVEQKLEVVVSPTKAQINQLKKKLMATKDSETPTKGKKSQTKLDGFVQVSKKEKKEKKDKNFKADGKDKKENKKGKKDKIDKKEKKEKKDKVSKKSSEVKTPMRKKLLRPVPVPEPTFSELFLGECIQERLQIRDFILRYGKDPLRVVASHIKSFADLEKPWSHTAVKNLLTNALSLVSYEKTWANDSEEIVEAISKIKKAKADTNETWLAVQEVVDIFNGVEEGSDREEADTESLKAKFALLQSVIYATSETFDVKSKMDANALQLYKLTKDSKAFVKEESKKLRELHGKDKVAQKEVDSLLERFEKYQKMKIWLKKRVLDGRSVRIGRDIQGNTYWLLCPLDKDDTWAATRIYVEKGEDVTLPIASSTLLKDADVNGHPGDISIRGTKDRPLREKKQVEIADSVEAPVASKNWFYVEGAKSIYELANWVEYKANVAFFEREVKKDGAKNGAWASPSSFMVRLDTPASKGGDPTEFFDKEARDNIVRKLKDVGDMADAFENSKESETLFITHNLQLSGSAKSTTKAK